MAGAYLAQGLLGVAIVVKWLSLCGYSATLLSRMAWLCAASAIGLAFATGVLSPNGLPYAFVILLLMHLHDSSSHIQHRPAFRPLLLGATIVCALALSLRLIPGVHNVLLIPMQAITPEAVPFKQYLNFDKGLAGLLLLCAYKPSSPSGWRQAWRPLLASSALSTSVVILAALSLNYVRFEPKWPPFAAEFLVANLLFTCVAEELLFRGFLQNWCRLQVGRYVAARRSAEANARFVVVIPVIVSSVLFAAAHLPGGLAFAFLSLIASLGYATAYALTRRIDVAIVAHFMMNATHFLLYTYPSLRYIPSAS